jgi:hypothetical protein
MKRRKSEVDVTKQTLAQAEQGTAIENKNSSGSNRAEDDLLSLDPVDDPALSMGGEILKAKTEYHVPNHVGETVVLQPGQKAKRKYTRRADKNTAIPAYQKRAIAEYRELTERREKLAAFLAALPSVAEQERLTKQLLAMVVYESALKDRIDNFPKENA